VPRNQVLLVEDDRGIRFGIRKFLPGRDFDVDEADTLKQGEEIFKQSRPDIVILDYSLPDGNALEILPRLKTSDPSIPVVILTGHGSIDLAVRAIKELAVRSQYMHINDGLRLESAIGAVLRQTEDAKEGPRAFAEKRPPFFRGR